LGTVYRNAAHPRTDGCCGCSRIVFSLTIPFFFYIAYQVGRFVLQTAPLLNEPEFTWEWISSEFNHIWKPFLSGSILCGLIFGAIGYFGMQFYWRWHVNLNWKKRQKARSEKAAK
jgi:uncharacterized protein